MRQFEILQLQIQGMLEAPKAGRVGSKRTLWKNELGIAFTLTFSPVALEFVS